MEPETTIPATGGNNKKIIFISLAVILVIVGVAVLYLFMQKGTAQLAVEVVKIEPEKKSAEQIEKERILAELVQAIPKDTTTQVEKAQILKNLTKSIPKVNLSSEEKAKILQALASSTPQ